MEHADERMEGHSLQRCMTKLLVQNIIFNTHPNFKHLI